MGGVHFYSGMGTLTHCFFFFFVDAKFLVIKTAYFNKNTKGLKGKFCFEKKTIAFGVHLQFPDVFYSPKDENKRRFLDVCWRRPSYHCFHKVGDKLNNSVAGV